MAPLFQNTVTFNHYIINHGIISFLKFFPPLLDTKHLFAMKIGNHHDKKITSSKSWDSDSFFEPGFGVPSNSNHRARICTTLWPPNPGEHLGRRIGRIKKR